VVVILGILSAIVVPQFASATQQASTTATYDQLQKIRRGIQVYSFRNSGRVPDVVAGDGTWGSMLSQGLLRQVPVNLYVGGPNARTIVEGTAADTAAHSNYGWIYNPATGDLWAASFDASDQPIP
jgi:type II secretory pathway pseudopilin PulG